MSSQQTTPSEFEIADGLSDLSPHSIQLSGDFDVAIEYYFEHGNLGLTFTGVDISEEIELSQNLLLSPTSRAGRSVLHCTALGLEVEFAALLSLIIERIRLGVAPREAIHAQMESWKALTTGPDQVDILGITGLFGELWMAVRLAELGFGMDTWTALDGSVFDFATTNLEIEVKTTTRQTHIHRISRPDQLLESIGATAWFVSIMVARTTNTSGQSIGTLTHSLGKLGWSIDRVQSHIQKLDLGPSKRVSECAFALRSEPIWVPATTLPLVTPQTLRELIGPDAIRLSQFEYDIDVTGLGISTPLLVRTLDGEQRR
jgi:hypothetical protein